MFDPVTYAAAVKAAPKPTDAQIAKYFEDHPEAALADGSVTAEKFAATAFATQAEVSGIVAIIEGSD